jgi:hypothetical protein
MRVLKSKRIKLAVIVGTFCAVGAGATAMAVTPLDDTWNAGANSAFAAHLAPGSTAKFSSTLVTITCTKSTSSGGSIGSGPDVGFLVMHHPTFTDGVGVPCTTNVGASATVTESGTWRVANISDTTNSHCPTGTGNDETTTNKDCQLILVPKDGATVTFGSPLNCTLTIAPNGPVYVPLTVTDPGGTTKTRFTVDNAQVPFSGCGTSGTGTQTGTYMLTAPNGGVVYDNS